jgi:hypothetical protein
LAREFSDRPVIFIANLHQNYDPKKIDDYKSKNFTVLNSSDFLSSGMRMALVSGFNFKGRNSAFSVAPDCKGETYDIIDIHGNHVYSGRVQVKDPLEVDMMKANIAFYLDEMVNINVSDFAKLPVMASEALHGENMVKHLKEAKKLKASTDEVTKREATQLHKIIYDFLDVKMKVDYALKNMTLGKLAELKKMQLEYKGTEIEAFIKSAIANVNDSENAEQVGKLLVADVLKQIDVKKALDTLKKWISKNRKVEALKDLVASAEAARRATLDQQKHLLKIQKEYEKQVKYFKKNKEKFRKLRPDIRLTKTQRQLKTLLVIIEKTPDSPLRRKAKEFCDQRLK